LPQNVANMGYGVKKGFDPMDPVEARAAAKQYLIGMQKEHGFTPAQTLQAYNWGPGNMVNYIRTGGESNPNNSIPAETTDYLTKITAAGGNINPSMTDSILSKLSDFGDDVYEGLFGDDSDNVLKTIKETWTEPTPAIESQYSKEQLFNKEGQPASENSFLSEDEPRVAWGLGYNFDAEGNEVSEDSVYSKGAAVGIRDIVPETIKGILNPLESGINAVTGLFGAEESDIVPAPAGSYGQGLENDISLYAPGAVLTKVPKLVKGAGNIYKGYKEATKPVTSDVTPAFIQRMGEKMAGYKPRNPSAGTTRNATPPSPSKGVVVRNNSQVSPVGTPAVRPNVSQMVPRNNGQVAGNNPYVANFENIRQPNIVQRPVPPLTVVDKVLPTVLNNESMVVQNTPPAISPEVLYGSNQPVPAMPQNGGPDRGGYANKTRLPDNPNAAPQRPGYKVVKDGNNNPVKSGNGFMWSKDYQHPIWEQQGIWKQGGSN